MTEITFGFLLYDAARLLRRDFDRRARQLGLTRSQWAVLFHLARREGCNQTILADILEIEPITLVRLLDKLEAAGWLERRPDPQDRRVRLLYLTARAHPLLEKMKALGMETRNLALKGFSKAERETISQLLSRVRSNLSDHEAIEEKKEVA